MTKLHAYSTIKLFTGPTLKDSMKDNWYLAYNLVHAMETNSLFSKYEHWSSNLTHKKRPLTKIHNIRSFINS